MAGQIPGLPLAFIAVGGVLVWSGVENEPVTAIFRNLAKGTAPAKGPAGSYVDTADTTTVSPAPGSDTVGGSAPAGDTSAHTAKAAANQAIARVLAAPYGWSTGQQWADLVSLWNQESGWNELADNPSSGAYGIPQALPGSKMASAGANWRTSATTQIRWGLSYIHDRPGYGSPSAAWAHEKAEGWY